MERKVIGYDSLIMCKNRYENLLRIDITQQPMWTAKIYLQKHRFKSFCTNYKAFAILQIKLTCELGCKKLNEHLNE